MLGNPAAPYLNSLITPGNPNAAQVSYASGYDNVQATPSGNNPSIHPSSAQPGLARVRHARRTLNDNDPINPRSKTSNAPNLRAAPAAGITWKSYEEDIDLVPTSGTEISPSPTPRPSPSPLEANGLSRCRASAALRLPTPIPTTAAISTTSRPSTRALFFTATNGGMTRLPRIPRSVTTPRCSNCRPTSQTNRRSVQLDHARPVQRHALFVEHGFTYNGVTYKNTDQQAVAQGDNFLSKIIPQIMASQAFKNNGAIVIWGDETEGTDPNDYSHTMPEIVISPLAKGNAYDSTLDYTHSSDLKTWEESSASKRRGRVPGRCEHAGHQRPFGYFFPAIPAPSPSRGP